MTKTVHVDMNFAPTSVHILDRAPSPPPSSSSKAPKMANSRPLVAGRAAAVRCMTEGSKPRAEVVWYIGGRRITEAEAVQEVRTIRLWF